MSLQTETLLSKIQALGMSVSACGSLVGAPNLGSELGGLRDMPNHRFVDVNKKLTALLQIADKIAPLKLSFKDMDLVRRWLDLFEAGDLIISVIDKSKIEEPSAATEPEFHVAFGGKHFFAGTNPSGRDLGHLEREKAVPLSHDQAIDVRNRLRRSGFKDADLVEISTIAPNKSHQ